MTAGLEVHLDAGNPLSYPGTGLTWTDLITGTAFTLQAIFPSGAPTQPFFSDPIGYFNFTSNNAAGTFIPTIAPTRGAVEIWFRWRDSSPITAAVLFTGNGANWASLGNVTGTHPNESIEFNSGVAAVMDDQQGHFHYRDSEWHQMVAVIDGAANLIYVDGVPVVTTFRSGNATSTGLTNLPATLIGKFTAGYQFDGDIAIVRVYDTAAFSAADVAQNYAADAPRFATFQPDSIAGLTLWLDPSDANSLTLSGADIVEARDKALAVPTAAAVSAVGNEPTLTTVGGINWMQFAGGSSQRQTLRQGNNTADILFSDLFGGGGTASWEIVMVLRPDSASTNVAATYQNNSAFGDTAGYIGTYVKDPGGATLTLMTYMWDSGDRHGDISIAGGTKVIVGQSKAAGAADWHLLNDTTRTVVGNYNNLGGNSNPLYLGRGYNPPNYFTGLIGEVCIFDHELSASERTDLGAYLKAKWGTP